MKTFEHLNHQELIALDQDQIAHYIKLRKAETGIKIITLPEAPTYQGVPAPDLELYEACGYSFADKAKAQEIADTVNKYISGVLKIDYDWSRGGKPDMPMRSPASIGTRGATSSSSSSSASPGASSGACSRYQ